MTVPADPITARISAAVAAHRESRAEAPREELVALWDEVSTPMHRCLVAHYLADMVDDPALALMWDTRALDAAAGLPDEHVGFYPSLYLNLADNLRRLGSFDAAEGYLATAREYPPATADDAYAELMRTAFDSVGRLIRERSTAPSPTAPE